MILVSPFQFGMLCEIPYFYDGNSQAQICQTVAAAAAAPFSCVAHSITLIDNHSYLSYCYMVGGRAVKIYIHREIKESRISLKISQ